MFLEAESGTTGASGRLLGSNVKQYGTKTKRFAVPAVPVSMITHSVGEEDTLQGLSIFYNVSTADIKRVNSLWTNDSIHSRRVLKIPVYAENVRQLSARDMSILDGYYYNDDRRGTKHGANSSCSTSDSVDKDQYDSIDDDECCSFSSNSSCRTGNVYSDVASFFRKQDYESEMAKEYISRLDEQTYGVTQRNADRKNIFMESNFRKMDTGAGKTVVGRQKGKGKGKQAQAAAAPLASYAQHETEDLITFEPSNSNYQQF
eukprot:Nk52_evm24s279 gene=Nk52_evmTU24s279